VNFKAFDLGGHEIARKVWKDYYAKVDAIVYLVDAADRERFPESQRELNGLLSDDGLSTVPFLVLGNKVGARCVWQRWRRRRWWQWWLHNVVMVRQL